ncbi:Intermembrane transport protein YebT [Vibrio stylophorae]|uniref:Intermembrane transport protein YebT n=1 Tax=Vibrio stylophorae TaxID=659351 RepID=A0ABN8DT07_9VIBR|nr:MlaD family protein [Vibrio stylophorae]CAH0533463.1 Intermembrane transport protein YebT [Vibrio stylophorae]
MDNTPAQQPEIYQPSVEKRGLSPLWILPIVALILGGWLVYKAMMNSGQQIEIHFKSAHGLVAGRTPIRFQGLEVGMVREIHLDDSLTSIYVVADIYPQASKYLSEATEFWIVSPSASLAGISGLDALVSGNYIAMHPGKPTDTPKTQFTALDAPPRDLIQQAGLNFTLISSNLGSVSIGAPIVYKRIPVGEVTNYTLSENNKKVLISAVIKPEYAKLVNSNSRFWNVSGIRAQVGFDGIDVQMDSLAATIHGAIAFDSPKDGDPVNKGQSFTLYPDLDTAGRGVLVSVTLPDNHNINPHGAPVIYKGLEVGQITRIRLDKKTQKIVASVAIAPTYEDFLTNHSQFVVERPEISFQQISNLKNVVSGNYLSLHPQAGEPSDAFVAISHAELLAQRPGTRAIVLTSHQTHGLSDSSTVVYRGLTVGHISQVQLKKGQDRVIETHLLIDPEYAHLIGKNTRFYIEGGIQADISWHGAQIDVPSADQLFRSAVSFYNETAPKGQSARYTLYPSAQAAQLASQGKPGYQNVILAADNAAGVAINNAVFYRNIEVGYVRHIDLSASGVTITLAIENGYRHLLKANSVFWRQSGINIEANLQGVSIESGPLSSLVAGGISFDQFSNVNNRDGQHYRLFASQKAAQHAGKMITLLTDSASYLSVGTAIRYKGIQIGEVMAINPNLGKQNVFVEAMLYPEFSQKFSQSGSRFWSVTPKIGLTKTENLDALLASYIDAIPGNGKTVTQFHLSTPPSLPGALRIVLEANQRGSVSAGTPVLYRDMEIGQVRDVRLGALADRVLFDLEIEPQYTYLIRRNSRFWNQSGIDVELGLSGANIKTGSLDSLVRGGIAIATPENQPLQNKATRGQHFALEDKAPVDWQKWHLAIPKH